MQPIPARSDPPSSIQLIAMTNMKTLLCSIACYLKQVQIKSKVKLQVIIPNFPMAPIRYVQCVASAQGSPTAPST